MNFNRKYPKITGYCVYAHVTPEKMVYFGITGNQLQLRWRESQYKTTALYHYIELYGWDNIEHRLILDGLTKEQALILEDWFIRKTTAKGFCINRIRSGVVPYHKRKEYIEPNKEYQKAYYIQNKDRITQYRKEYNQKPDVQKHKKEYRKQYQQTDKYRNYKKEYNQKPNVKQAEWDRQHRPEYIIYFRVRNYNKSNPDKIIETPLEAKQKYIATGYIPDYIKSDNL